MVKKKKYLQYFELSIEGVSRWELKDYLFFIVESIWQTVVPFIAGMLLVSRNELFWLIMVALPIYFKMNIDRKDSKGRKKRIYVKD